MFVYFAKECMLPAILQIHMITKTITLWVASDIAPNPAELRHTHCLGNSFIDKKKPAAQWRHGAYIELHI